VVQKLRQAVADYQQTCCTAQREMEERDRLREKHYRQQFEEACFLKVRSLLPLYSKCTGALTFPDFQRENHYRQQLVEAC
jgi:polynucleotide 5'-kinase involved in rRNA processing